MSEDLKNCIERLNRIEVKLSTLMNYIIPELKDISKYLKEAKQTANKGKPPRKQPKKYCKHIGCTNNSVEVNEFCSIHQEDIYP